MVLYLFEVMYIGVGSLRRLVMKRKNRFRFLLVKLASVDYMYLIRVLFLFRLS